MNTEEKDLSSFNEIVKNFMVDAENELYTLKYGNFGRTFKKKERKGNNAKRSKKRK